MKLRRTIAGAVLERDGEHLLLAESWDDLFRHADPVADLRAATGHPVNPTEPLAPIVSPCSA